MGALILFLLLTLLLFGLGFTVKVLWYVALFFVIVWAIGFVARGTDRTWYRW